METIEDVKCLRALLADHVQVGSPHIRANELDLSREFFPDQSEEALEGLDGSFAADPEQTREILIDLVNQGQVFVAFGVLHLIHTDGADRSQRAMVQAPGDDVLDSVANLFPGGAKRLGCFLPGELACPAGQKQHIGSGQPMLTIAPGNLLDHHATIPAVDASHAVQQENQKAPQRNELEAPLGEMIVTGRGLVAPRTDRRRALPRPDVHLDACLVGSEAGVLVDEPAMAMAVI